MKNKNKFTLLFLVIYVISLYLCLNNNNIATAWAQSDSCIDGQSLVIDTVNKRYKCVTISSGGLGSGNVNMTLANEAGTGTTLNKLVKITGAPSTAIISATTDADQVVGVCTSGCGNTGNATIAILGQVSCVFDGATTAGNFVVNSDATAGNCEDAGSAFPTDRAAIGRVLSTNVGAGTYSMELMTPDIAFQNAGNGKSKPGTPANSFQYNSSNQFGGGNLFREDANTVAQRNGTTIQNFFLYKTFTDASNFEALKLYHTTTQHILESVEAGTGVTRALSLRANTIEFQTDTSGTFTVAWDINSTSNNGSLQPRGNFQTDLGSQSKHVKDVYSGATPARIGSAFNKTDTSLSNVTGLSRAVESTKAYYFEAVLYFDADVTGGHKYAINSSGTLTSITYHITSICDSTNLNVITSRQTAEDGAAGQAGCTAGITIIRGYFKGGAGTLSVRFAQNAASGTSTLLSDSTFKVEISEG